jgi:hypothetical protein
VRWPEAVLFNESDEIFDVGFRHQKLYGAGDFYQAAVVRAFVTLASSLNKFGYRAFVVVSGFWLHQ